MKWFVYMLRCADDTYYCGITTDLRRRALQHNGKLPGGARYTRARRPVKMGKAMRCASRAAAAKNEREWKKLPHALKELWLMNPAF